MSDSPRPADAPVRPDLAFEFPVPTLDAWRDEVTKLLKGAPYEKVMSTATPEGIALRALYTKEETRPLDFPASLPGEAPYTRGAHLLGHRLDPWEVAQETPAAEVHEYDAILRRDLAAGQTAVVLGLDAAGRAGLDPEAAPAEWVGRGGLSCGHVDELAAALGAISFAAAPAPGEPGCPPIFLHGGSAALPAAALFFAHFRRAGGDPTRLRGSFGTDPLADALAGSTRPLDECYDDLASLTQWVEEAARPGDYQARTVTAWGVRWREAGGNAVEELAYTLGSAVQSLRELERRGVDPEVAATRLFFGFAAGPQLLLETAKLRAARLLWGRITEACGFENPPASMWIHVRTLARNLSAIDAETNILRGTTAALSAILGGCDSLTVLPFDLPLGPASERSRRLARNTQLILRDESHLDLVIDAVGGAHALESLTAELAEQAWALFREIEAAGGMRAALESGTPQARLAAAAEKQQAALATRREVLVGTNQYPNAAEPPLRSSEAGDPARCARRRDALRAHTSSRRSEPLEAALAAVREKAGDPVRRTKAARFETAIQAAAAGATLGELASAGRGHAPAVRPASSRSPISLNEGGNSFPLLPVSRLSLPFEAVRAAAGRLPASATARPPVLLACLGSRLEFMPRIEFTRSFFRLAGLAAAEREFDLSGPEAAMNLPKAVAEEGARVVVLVSIDARYPEWVPAATARLRATSPPPTVLLAGLPADPALAAAFRAAGVDEFLHLRCDAPAILQRLIETIGGRA